MTLGVGAQGLMTSSWCKQNMYEHTPIMPTSIKKQQHPDLKQFFFIENYNTFPIFRGFEACSDKDNYECWTTVKLA